MVKGMTISDAAHKWVNEFNAIPQSMIERLMRDRYEEWEELTMPHVGSRVHVFDLPDDCETRWNISVRLWRTPQTSTSSAWIWMAAHLSL